MGDNIEAEKKGLGNLAKLFVEKMHQEWAKRKKAKPNGPIIENKQPKTLFMAYWQ